MERVVIIGASTSAMRAYLFIKKYSLYDVVGFAVNEQYRTESTYYGLPVFAIEELDTVIDKTKDFIFVAMLWNNLNNDRRKVYEELKGKGYRFANLVSPNAVVNGTIEGDNCWVWDFVVLNFNATVGCNSIVEVGASIGHDSVISDHCFIGAKATLGGCVVIGEQSFVGLGAVVFDNVNVGRKCIVGAATALKRNMADFSVYKTSLDNYVTKQYDEDTIEAKLQFSKNVR